MSSIVFFTSGHGFGHASRDVEVINALATHARIDVIIRSAVNADLLGRTLRSPFRLMPGACDTGIVQTSSIANDDDATVDAAVEFYRDFSARADAEAMALRDPSVRLVVGDIAPLAFEVASRLGVPGVAFGNFTWDWIYETHPGFLPRGEQAIAAIRAGYRKADCALQLPFSAGFGIFRDTRALPLVARRPTRDRASTRAHFGLPAAGRVALLSFGGYGMPALDLTSIDAAPDWTIATTDRVTTSTGSLPAHVRLIPEQAFVDSGFRYEDLVAASDVVMTKPGYGIIAECIVSGTPMLYTSRGHFREYDLLVREMPKYLRCRFMSQDDLFAGRWREALEGVLRQPEPPERLATNGAEAAAEMLAAIAERSLLL